MKIITVSSPQQGVGKSVVAVHLAYYLREICRTVLVVDLAYTGGTSWTLSEFACGVEAPELFKSGVRSLISRPVALGFALVRSNVKAELSRWRRGDFGVPLDIASERLSKSLAMFAPAFDYCVIDTAPGTCTRTRAAIGASNYLVMPVAPREGAVEAVDKRIVDSFVHKFSAARTGLLLSRQRLANPRDEAAANQLTAAFPGAVLPTRIFESSDISKALMRKVPAWANTGRISKKSVAAVRDSMACIVAKADEAVLSTEEERPPIMPRTAHSSRGAWREADIHTAPLQGKS